MDLATTHDLAGFRLSPQQERLWLLSRGRTEDRYVSALLARLPRGATPEGVREALGGAVERHEILRTRCARGPGMPAPLQVIAEAAAAPVPFHDWRTADGAGGDERLDAWLRGCIARCAAEEGGAPVVELAGLPGGDALVVVLPALLGDGATLLRLLRELTGPEAEGDTPLQYVEFAEALHDLRGEETYAAGREHWRGGWRTPTPATEVGARAPGDARAPFAPQGAGLLLEGDDLAGTLRLAAETGTTLEAVLLAGWAALLARLARASGVTLGVLGDGRGQGELDDLMGTVAQYLPFSADTDGATVHGLVRRTAEALADAAAYQAYFDWTEAAPEGTGFFSLAFQYETATREAAGAVVERLLSHVDRFDVKLQATRHDDTVALTVHYDPACMDAGAAARLGPRLVQVLRGMAAGDAALGALDVLPAAERDRVLVEPNRTARAYPDTLCVHQLVEERARRAPHALAVVADDGTLTFGELDRRAGRLARVLVRRGVGPERCVALCLGRSTDLVVAMLATWKAGGAYLPLDSAYPAERIAFMLADARAAVVVAERSWEGVLAPSLPVLWIEAEREAVAREEAGPLAVPSHPDQLAYLIYTSGSTGTPKGVLVPHRGLVNYLAWCVDAYGVETMEEALVTSSPAFDLTVTSLWAPLAAGRAARLTGGERAVGRLAEAWRADTPTLLKLTPVEVALAARMLETAGPAGRAGAVVIGGEALYGETVGALRERAPSVRVFNEYGPTETVVGCCVHEVPAGAVPGGPVPIGRPIGNTALYLLDARLEPVPIGVPGEIHVGGHGVARGYANHPALTAGRFLPDPFRGEPGARMYRTGDLARWSEAGELEYVGRLDHQVKLGGYRVELGEVEDAIRAQPGVRDAVAAVRDEGGTRYLAAYVVFGDAPPAGAETGLREALGKRLPPWMVPARFAWLEALPLTAHGKVDRAALPRPEAAARPPADAGSLPAGGLEAAVAAVWEEALGIAPVRLDDNFFDVGGYSLLMFEIHARLQAALGRKLSVIDLFAFPTVRALARHLAADGSPDAADGDGDAEFAAARLHAARREQALQARRATLRDGSGA